MTARMALLAATLLALPTLATAACTRDVEDPPREEAGSPAVEHAPADATCDPEVDQALRAWAAAGFSGTITLSTRGEIDCEVASGTADEEQGRPTTVDTVFAIGSVSKAFAAAAVLDLAAAGDLALEDRAGDVLPGLDGPAAEATVEQLLLHTAGLTGEIGPDGEPLGRDEAVAALGRLARSAPPAREHLYSNAGYALLALIVEEVTGTPYRDHLVAEVLTVGGDVLGGFWDGEPAAPGPRAVGYDEDGRPLAESSTGGPSWATAGNGDLAMTTTQLARWTQALFGGEVIDPAALDLLVDTSFEEGEGRTVVPGWVRLGADQLGEPAYGAAGGGGDTGHESVALWMPESERVVAISSNTPDVVAEDLLAELAPALAAGDPLPVPATPSEADPEEVAAAEGTYALPGGDRIEVAADEDGLAVRALGPEAVRALFPPVDRADARARSDHEEQVRALLAGDTPTGREELAALEEDLGAITSVEVLGTVDVGELRTYARIEARGGDALAWYALDAAGGIAAAEITDDPPTLVVAPTGAGTYRPADPTGGGPSLTLTVSGDELVLTGPEEAATARRT